MPSISVVIPVYNVAKNLEDCINCILNQTFQDFEIILVDDGSTDGSGVICDNFAKKDSRIRMIHKKNEGAGPTRTRGLSEATGDYIYFPDADDWLEPNTLEDLYHLARSNDADLVICNYTSVNYSKDGKETGRKVGKCEEAIFTSSQECKENVMCFFPTSTIFDVPWNKLYRRKIAVEKGLKFQPLRRCQDAVWNLDFYNHCTQVVSTSKAYYYYRENTQESTWRKFPIDYIDIQVYYFLHLRKLLTSWGIYNGKVKEHYDTSFVIAIASCAEMYDNPRWNLSRSQQREYIKKCISRSEVREFIPEASIRPDQSKTFELIKNENVVEIMYRHKVSVYKDRMRQNKFLRSIWHLIKR